MRTTSDIAWQIAWHLQEHATYKPGYTLTFTHVERNVVFHLDARVNDSLHGTPNTAIAYTRVIPVLPGQSYEFSLALVTAGVREALHKFEAHESDEWFQVAGKQVHPPHQHYTETT